MSLFHRRRHLDVVPAVRARCSAAQFGQLDWPLPSLASLCRGGAEQGGKAEAPAISNPSHVLPAWNAERREGVLPRCEEGFRF